MRRIFVSLFCAAGFLPAQTPPNFTVTDFGVLPGKVISQATAISSNGTVVGYSATANFSFDRLPTGQGSAQGWTYSNGVLTPLQVQSPSLPLGINASGQIVGLASVQPTLANDFDAFAPLFYLNGVVNTPNNLVINNVCAKCTAGPAAPFAISDTGAVIVTSYPEQNAVVGDGGPFMQAAVWANGTLTVLPLPSDCPALDGNQAIVSNPSFCLTKAFGISGNGQYVAGFVWYWNRGSFEPAMWSNGRITTFGTGGVITSVNDSGQGVGVHKGHAVIFNPGGTLTDLGTGFDPAAINNTGWIVGSDSLYLGPGNYTVEPVAISLMPGSANAILWTNNTTYNLNTCSCISNSAGWEFDFAYAVNDAGQIVGTGFHNGVQTGFLLTPQMPPVIAAVVNAASFAKGGVVPGEIATAFGTNLTSDAGINLTSGLPLPSSFLNDSLMINNEAVPLFAVDNSNGQQQINFQVPWDVASGPTATIAVSNSVGTSASISVPVLAAQPGVFNYSAGGNNFGAILHADYQLADAAHPAKPGETVLIYCTGLGAVSSPPADGEPGKGQATLDAPTVTIGETKSLVSFSGLAPGFVGLYQVNAEVPAALHAGNQKVVVEMGGVSSNSVLLPVQ